MESEGHPLEPQRPPWTRTPIDKGGITRTPISKLALMAVPVAYQQLALVGVPKALSKAPSPRPPHFMGVPKSPDGCPRDLRVDGRLVDGIVREAQRRLSRRMTRWRLARCLRVSTLRLPANGLSPDCRVILTGTPASDSASR